MNRAKWMLGGIIAAAAVFAFTTSGEPVSYLRSVILRVVRRTSKFEGRYDSCNKNTDKRGLSWGIIQWVQAKGQLGVILAECAKADPEAFVRIFGEHNLDLLIVTNRPTDAERLAPVGGQLLWSPYWVARFEAAGAYEPFQRVQDNTAADGEHMGYALDIVRVLGLRTERGLSMAYDRSVQQGLWPLKWAERLPLEGDETDRIVAFANRCYVNYRRPSPSEKGDWRQVGSEWHLFSGKVDLYADVKRRTESILLDPDLSDLPMQAGGGEV